MLVASSATAAPGFIADSQVEKGNLYTSVTIQFRCKIPYLGHDPSGKTEMRKVLSEEELDATA